MNINEIVLLSVDESTGISLTLNDETFFTPIKCKSCNEGYLIMVQNNKYNKKYAECHLDFCSARYDYEDIFSEIVQLKEDIYKAKIAALSEATPT